MCLNTETMLSPLPEVRDRAEEESKGFSFSFFVHQLFRINNKEMYVNQMRRIHISKEETEKRS